MKNYLLRILILGGIAGYFPTMLILEEIKGLEDNIAKHIQPIAQGFRIIINSIDKINSMDGVSLESSEEKKQVEINGDYIDDIVMQPYAVVLVEIVSE